MASTPLPLIPWAKTTLLSASKSLESLVVVQRTALDLFVLGYSNQANKLIDALYEHSGGIEFDVHEWNTMRALYDAWEGTKTKPRYISDPDPDRIFNGKGSDVGPRHPREEEWDTNWHEGLPEKMSERALRKQLGKDDVDEALGLLNGDFRYGSSNITIGAVVQVAMLGGEENIAKDLVQTQVRDVYLHLQQQWNDTQTSDKGMRKHIQSRLGLHYSPEIWKLLVDISLGETLGVNIEALDTFVAEGLTLIRQRFTQGPARPYVNTPIPELLRIMDASYIAARTANPRSGVHMCIIGHSLPSTFLIPGASSSSISDLEDLLSTMPAQEDGNSENVMLPEGYLPDDYKEFLKISDGFQVERGDSTGILCSVEEVGLEEVSHLHDMEYTLFPYDYTCVTGIDNIDLDPFTCFTIGSGGDEGQVVLIPPSSIEPLLQRFEDVYAKASERHKRMYERAAVDLYGGLERMRGLQWLVLCCYHWDPEQRIFGGFREYLEECVKDAVRRREEDERKAEGKEDGRGESE